MATAPAYTATPNGGTPALLGAAETSLTVPTTASVILTAGSAGSIINEIIINAATTSLAPAIVAGLVYVFLFDGATNHLFDTLSIPLPAATASSTVPPIHLSKLYTQAIPTGWTVKASNSIAGNANLLKVICLGGNF